MSFVGAEHASNEEATINAFHKSEMWRWFQTYLKNRREVLIQSTAKDTSDLWKLHGALQEVNRLLRAPELVLQFLQQQRLSAHEHDEPGASDEQLLPMGRFSEGTDDF